MSNEAQSASVTILDKEFQFACTAEEKPALLESARFLDKKMKEIRKNGRTIGMERIAVMAVMNITYELLEHQDGGNLSEDSLAARLKEMRESVEKVLGANPQLTL